MPALSKITVLADHATPTHEIATYLRSCGITHIEYVTTPLELGESLRAAPSDIILIYAQSPTASDIHKFAVVSGLRDRPVLLFCNRCTADAPGLAIQAGFSAFVVDGAQPQRLDAILKAATARFTVFKSLRDDLAESRQQLEERKMIDRAKGLLMKARQIDEAAAYALLRSTAMNRKQRLGDVARALVTASDLLS